MNANDEALLTILELHAQRRALEASLRAEQQQRNALLDLVRDLKAGARSLDGVRVDDSGAVEWD